MSISTSISCDGMSDGHGCAEALIPPADLQHDKITEYARQMRWEIYGRRIYCPRCSGSQAPHPGWTSKAVADKRLAMAMAMRKDPISWA